MAEEFTANQSVEQYSAVSEIYGEAISQVHGALSVNQASGDGNAQNNSRAISVTQGGVAVAITVNKQAAEMSMADMPDEAISRISDNAFSGTSGLIAINQTTGANNMQFNGVAIAMSIQGELSDAALAQTHSNTSLGDPGDLLPVNTIRAAEIDSTAFSGASGVIQINQSSGMGNVSSNLFELSMGQAD